MLTKVSMASFSAMPRKTSVPKQKSIPSFTGSVAGVAVEYLNGADSFLSHLKLKKAAEKVIAEVVKRLQNPKSQFLDWVKLPEKQIERGLDRIYDTVDNLRRATGNETLTVLGIGGSKHPLEHALGLSNLPGADNIHFYSGLDPMSFDKFKGEIGGQLKGSDYLVVSKSGTTFETEDAYLRIEAGLVEEYMAEGKTAEEAQQLANKHFVVVTDADASRSKLRREANAKGYSHGELFIHDDVGGRYSALDDHGLFALAYAGLSKDGMTQMLQGAVKMTKNALSKNIEENIAIQRAMFYVSSIRNRIRNSLHLLAGSVFGRGTREYLEQFHGESLKDTLFTTGILPDVQHYAAESFFNPKNKYNVTVTMLNDRGLPGWKNYNEYVQNIVTPAFAEVHPTSLEKLNINEQGVAPEAIGAYSQLKHFETIYKGMLRRAMDPRQKLVTLKNAIWEVLQPFVEAYKKRNLGKGNLHPGSNE